MAVAYTDIFHLPKFTQIGIFGLKIYIPSGNPAPAPKNYHKTSSLSCPKHPKVSLTHFKALEATKTGGRLLII
jgi:hypothetical protein